MIDPIPWEEIRRAWRIATCGNDELEPILDVRVKSPDNHLRIGENILDWWPRDRVANRVKRLEEHGLWGAQWDTPKGMLHTACVFDKASDDKELGIAARIAAGLKTIGGGSRSPISSAWHGKPCMMKDGIEQTVSAILRSAGIEWWHHASSTALPANLSYAFYESFTPREPGDIIEVVRILVELSFSRWTVVRVSHVDSLKAVG